MTPTAGYTEMKESGVHWMGRIPKHWGIQKAKFHFSQTNNRGNNTLILLAASQKYGVCPQSWLEGVVQVSENTDLQQFKTVHKNDFVISLRSFQGGFERSDFEGVCSPAYQVFHADASFDNNFLKYLFKNELFIDEMNSLTVGIREGRNIKYDDFANSLIFVPPLDEQSTIAAYLDTRCAKIDEIIAEAKASIEDYKQWKESIIYEAVTKGLDPKAEMKDSGVKWIGEIPMGWESKRLKDTFTFGKGLPITKADLVETGIPVISYGQIHAKSNTGTHLSEDLLRFVSEKYLKSNPTSVLHEGDIVLADTSEDLDGLGNATLIDTNETVFAGYHTIILRPQTPGFSKFLSYLFRTDYWRTQLRVNASGIKVFSATQKMLRSCYIVLPPKEEQDRIVLHLDDKCSIIESVIEEKTSLISDLETYKKSLIYEVVTGKRRVC